MGAVGNYLSGGAQRLANAQSAAQQSIGVKATTPTSNLSAPATTLPASQVAKTQPVPTPAPVQTNTSANTGGYTNVISGYTSTGQPIYSSGAGVAPTTATASGATNLGGGITSNTAAGSTLAQLAAQQGLVPDPNNPGQYIQPSQVGTTTSGSSTPSGTLGVGSPTTIAGNQTASGLLGNMVGQSQNLYQNENALNTGFITPNLKTIDQINQEEANLTGGGPQANAAAYGAGLSGLEGLKQSIQSNINSQQSNLGTFSGQAQSALGTGLTAATNQVQAPYNTPLYNPLTGTYTSSANSTSTTGSSSALQTAVNQTVQLMNAGATQADAEATSGLSNFGLAGSAALTSALQSATGGTYNPTAQAGVAAQNVATGTTLGSQAALLQPSLTGITQVGQQIQSLLNSGAANGLNALQPNWANTAIQTLQSTLGNNANVVSLTGMVNDAQGYISQILQSQDGLTPTAATSASAALNLQALSPNALSTVLSIRIGTYQQGASGALGAAANGLYQGTTANVDPNASVNTQTNSASGLSPGEQAAAGLGISAISGLVDWASDVFGGVAKAAITGAAAGEGASAVTPGAAAAVLGQ